MADYRPAHKTMESDPQKPTHVKKRRSEKKILKVRKTKDSGRKMRAQTLYLTQNECCVVNCGGRSHNDTGQRIRNNLTFYSFPVWRKNEGVFLSDLSKRRREAWIKAVGIPGVTFDDECDQAKVCSKHFVSGKPAYGMMEKDPDWAPSLNLNNEKSKKPQKIGITRSPVKFKKPKKKKQKEIKSGTEKAAEKPGALSWKDLKSRLQVLMQENSRPTKTTSIMDSKSLPFEECFRNALNTSLDSCLVPRSQSSTETHSSFSRKPPSCENCVKLKERILMLEEKLATPHHLLEPPVFSEWTEPLSQAEPKQSQRPTLDQNLSSQNDKLDLIRHHWFLRCSPKVKLMWCHVCRLYAGDTNAERAFVAGTNFFHNQAVVQHSQTPTHKDCVKRFKARKSSTHQ